MDKQERLMRKMEEIWKEVTEKRTNAEWVKSRLQWEDWESIGREAVLIARNEVRRRRWRGSSGGVLPRGYDAEAVAWEVIEEVVQGHGRIVPGWTRERLVKEIARLISGRVRLLCSLKETSLMRNEWDIKPRNKNGEPVSVLTTVPGESKNGYETIVESEVGLETLRRRIETRFDVEPELLAVFGCLWDGVTLSKEIAKRLGMTEAEVVCARRRLARRLRGLRKPNRL